MLKMKEANNEEDEDQGDKIVSNSETVECFKKYVLWMERLNKVDTIQIMQLQKMMEISVRT